MLPTINDSIGTICESLLNRSHVKMRRVYRKMDMENPRKLRSDQYYITANCKKLQSGFVMNSTEEENNFGIAYSIMTYKDTEQVYRLLRSIYRPSNHYCIHVDGKVNTLRCIALKAVHYCLMHRSGTLTMHLALELCDSSVLYA